MQGFSTGTILQPARPAFFRLVVSDGAATIDPAATLPVITAAIQALP